MFESPWLPCTFPLLIPSNANLHLNDGGPQLHKNTVFARADQKAVLEISKRSPDISALG